MSRARYLTTPQWAAILGRSERRVRAGAQRCLDGGSYLGLRPDVVVQDGVRGRGGRRLLVKIESLPPDQQQRALELFPDLAAAPPARKAKPGVRGNDRKPRVLIGRAWDRGIDLAPSLRAEIAAELDLKVRSLWASPAQRPGWRTVAMFAGIDLFDLCREAGSKLPDAELRKLCEVPRRYICDWSRERHRKTDIYRNDAKAFHDAFPAVRRERATRPLECLFGDGTAVDLLFHGCDGRQIKLWAILWLDDATGRLMGHFLPRPRGEGARMEHVALSFAVICTEVGFPEAVYVDNGSEYNWVKLLRSQQLARVIQAMPYNARAKSIEPAIRVFMAHQVSLIPGYLGSDRMAKKTQSHGRPATPFQGSLDNLLDALYGALEVFNSTPKESLGNRSAFQLWQQALDAGWRPEKADLSTLMEALSRPETRVVRQGEVRIGGIRYSSDDLCRRYDLEGERVSIMVPVVRGFPLSVLDPKGGFVSLVRPVATFGKTDVAGAKEAGRLKSLRIQGARDLARLAPPADLGPYQERFLGINPPPQETETAAMLELPGERGQAAAERRGLVNNGLETGAPALPAPAEEREPTYFEQLQQKKRSAS